MADNRSKKNESTFNEREIDIATKMQKELAPTVDVLSYMLDKTQTKFTLSSSKPSTTNSINTF